MAGSVNRVILVGNLGQDPDVKNGRNGDFADLSLATSKQWRDKATGERKEQTTWHRVRVFEEHLVKLARDHLKKGMKVYVEGELQNRSYDKDGEKRWMTEVILTGFSCKLINLTRREGSGGASPEDYGSSTQTQRTASDRKRDDEMDEDIPF